METSKKKILVIGDVMFDKYIVVSTNRMAQEANIPIYDEENISYKAGGAANVANNIIALASKECEVDLAGIYTDMFFEYDSGHEALRFDCNFSPCVYPNQDMEKVRYVLDDKIIFRSDNIKKFEQEDIDTFQREFLKCNLSKYDLIIISDYDKGTITKDIAHHIKSSGVKTIVDSKKFDLSMYWGFYALNVNENEYGMQKYNSAYQNVGLLFENVIVTKGKNGAALLQTERLGPAKFVTHKEEFPTTQVKAIDVTGCGDTHTAGFAVGILRDSLDIRNAIRFANQCATQVVTKFGTSRINKWDLSKNF